MKRLNMVVAVVLALANTSLVARPQMKDGKGSVIAKGEKAPRLRPIKNYPTMMDMTFPEFGAAVKKTDIALLSIGAIEEHGPNLPLATDALVGVAQLVDVQQYLQNAGIETIVGPPLNIGIT